MENKKQKLNQINFYLKNNNWIILFIILAQFSINCKCGQVAPRLHYNIENSDTSLNPDNISQLEQTDYDETPKEFAEGLENGTDYQDINETFEIKGHLETRDVERAMSFIPQTAECMPEYVTVNLLPNRNESENKNDNGFYKPHCASTRLHRCGGCCPKPRRKCTPTKYDNITFEVKYFTSEKTIVEHVIVQNHTKCECRCSTTTCNNIYQKLNAKKCLCECVNYDARNKCKQQSNKKWQESTCRCECATKEFCTTGFKFDEDTCNCVEMDAASNNRRDFILKATPIESRN